MEVVVEVVEVVVLSYVSIIDLCPDLLLRTYQVVLVEVEGEMDLHGMGVMEVDEQPHYYQVVQHDRLSQGRHEVLDETGEQEHL